MAELLYEYMIRAEAAGKVCRIWREMGPFPLRLYTNLELKVKAIKLMYVGDDLIEIARQLVEIQTVNSVEVLDRETGDGICVHKDWP